MLRPEHLLVPLLCGALVAACTESDADPAPAPTAQVQSEIKAPQQVDRVDLPVDWNAARADLRAVTLPSDIQAKVDTIPMPVLLPSDAALTRSAKVNQGDGWYVASMADDGLTVVVHGRDKAFLRPDLVRELKDTDAVKTGFVVSEAHSIYTVSFRKYGVHYALDVECAQPMTDPRCADPGHAKALVADLQVIAAGGAR